MAPWSQAGDEGMWRSVFCDAASGEMDSRARHLQSRLSGFGVVVFGGDVYGWQQESCSR